jgi:hypothetical protein
MSVIYDDVVSKNAAGVDKGELTLAPWVTQQQIALFLYLGKPTGQISQYSGCCIKITSVNYKRAK